MEYEKLTYTNERGESVELSTESVYHCNVSKDVEGIAGVTNVVYSTNSMGQHGDTYVGSVSRHGTLIYWGISTQGIRRRHTNCAASCLRY